MDAGVEETENRRRIARDACTKPCAIERGMRIVGGKWKGFILWHLKDGPVRFNDLSRMIAERLCQLQANGLVTQQVMQTAPVSVEYEITGLGRTALGFLDALRQWSESLPSR